MANDLLDKIPNWLKSLWHMENELRNAGRNGLVLRKDEASAHLAEARRHLEQAMNEVRRRELNQPTDRKRRFARTARFSPNLNPERLSCLASSGLQ
jgi:hypothetical protein